MKVIISSIILMISIIITSLLIFSNKKDVVQKFVTINTIYSYLYTDQKEIGITIYQNDLDFPMENKNLYEIISIHNITETRRLQLDLIEVIKLGEEPFNGEDFGKYSFKFKFPNFTNNYTIKDAKLEITLYGGMHMDLDIGDFYLMYEPKAQYLKWDMVEGKKFSENEIQLSELHVYMSEKLENIETIEIFEGSNLHYLYEDNLLRIFLDEYNKVVDNIPIIVKTTDGRSHVFYNFPFVHQMNLLSKAKESINIHVVS